MKDQWLKDIHDRMADMEADEPSGLWDDIENALELQGPDSACREPRGDRSARMLWFKRVSGIAAMVAVIVVAYLLFIPDVSMNVPLADVTDVMEHDPDNVELPSVASQEPLSDSGSLLDDTGSGGQKTIASVKSASEGEVGEEAVTGMHEESISQLPAVTDNKETTISDTVRTVSGDVAEKKRTVNRDRYIAYSLPSSRVKSRFSVSAFTSGALNSNVSIPASTSGSSHVSALGQDGKKWEDSPVLGILLFNQGKDMEREIKHHLPVRTGLAFSYRVNERLSLESGMTYTNLTSDIRYGSDEHYFSGKQMLHYVGIPLNIRYKVLSWKRLDLYASAGVLGEKCVSGKIERDYVLDNHSAETEKEDVREKPLQWSVNASAGLQLNVSSVIGLYAEPGVSYYIDNGSSVENIYKDKPCNFNLNVGVRFTFGKK
ncbi:outer membrane beta-barrel protein [uncultured Duncaniella sp.]|uniref:outer membrane beta-barrel protein n=1 Tax=uncultured Duncaniella sp. TaxID=2768039 RepID=UPI00266F3169|nr:outer membrane beta-barrel protein [uncultured Duncaniella sp.]